ncbi:NACHT domain-containing protein [Streptomyces sp. NPDC008092]|uniref:NACHT domain-containing protein n=1 Tax=Streptomyces sp. NPDC008092 TaxID=3364808 RepID=UPI0036EC0888
MAVAVRQQWEIEAGVRGLHDPRPLRVTWTAAPEPLVEEWAQLTQMAAEQQAGAANVPSTWAAAPAELAGSGGQILRVFLEQVPTRRLLILGGPGSGKTLLLVRLLLGLIECRVPGTPVPVLFTLSSWDPAKQDLKAWLVQQLSQDFDELAVPSTATFGCPSRAEDLLTHRLILPLLDGFDELPARARGMALDQMNSVLPPGHPVVLASRATEYAQAAAPVAALPRKLGGSAGIELLPLDPEETATYLCRDAGGAGTPAAARWDRVLHSLGSGVAVAQALSTPLMVFLARTIYNPRTGEALDAVPCPSELLDNPDLDSRAAVEAHLFRAFVPAAYRPHPRTPSPWSAADAERALRWLARHTERVSAGTTNLAWWQLHRAIPSWLPPVLIGALAAVLEFGVSWVSNQLVWHLASGSEVITWSSASTTGMLAGLVGGLAGRMPGGLTGALISSGEVFVVDLVNNPHSDYTPPMWHVLTAGSVYGFIGGLMGELAFTLAARRASGERTPLRSRRRWNRGFATLGLAVGAGYVYVDVLDDDHPQQMLPVAVALACLFCLVGGLAGGQRVRDTEVPPATAIRWSWDWGGLLIGLGGGVAVILPAWTEDVFHFGFSQGLANALTGMTGDIFLGSTPFAAGALSVYCLAAGVTCGIKAAAADLTSAPGPSALLGHDQHTFRKLGAVTALAVGLAIGLACWCAAFSQSQGRQLVYPASLETIGWAMTMPKLLRALVTGAMVGIVVGLAVAWNQAACGKLAIARGYLALRHRLPWRLMAFLADAHQHRGVLRQAGAVYQFRHIELQRYLAASSRQR